MKNTFKNTLKILKKSLIFFVAVSFLTPLLAILPVEVNQAQAISIGQGYGIIVYGKTGSSIPKYRIWDGSSWGNEADVGGATFANTPRFVLARAAPTRNEVMVGVQDSTGVVYFTKLDVAAGTWTQIGTNRSTSITDARAFGINYEKTSGDAMLVYGGAADPSYYTYDGSNTSGPTAITAATRTTGNIRWIQTASRKTSGTNEIALAYADANGDLNALTWDGSSTWTEQSTGAALSTGLENNAGATTMRAFDVQYESLSGDLLIAWGNSATVDPRYITRTAAGSWGSVQTATAFVEIPSIVELQAEPWDDRIALNTQDDTTSDSNDGDCGTWDGSAWVNAVNCDTARASQDAGDMPLGTGWVKSGSDVRAISFYSDVADVTLDFNFWVPGSGWINSQNYTPSPNCIASSNDDNHFSVDHNPFNNAEIMIIRLAGSAICAQKTNYTGANNLGGANAGDGSSLATASVSQYQPVWFQYFEVIPTSPPTVTTQDASSITATGATLNGNITATGGENATVRGFAWGTSATMAGDTATTTENGTFGTGAYTNSSLTLVCNTTYYFRPYATNPGGTGYGAISNSFTTSACPPTVTTQSASSVGQTSATLNGNITVTGGANATVRGFAWGTSATMAGDTATTTENGTFGTGAFTDSSLTLVCNTAYYSRAYATNSAGTSYGAISSSFTTSACSPPTVTTQSASSITATGATLNGNITSIGSFSATVRGFAWGTSATMAGDTATTTENGTFGTGAFTDSSLTLVCNTTYYSRAYATNPAGTSLGAISSSFTTSACPAVSVDQDDYRIFATATSSTGISWASSDTTGKDNDWFSVTYGDGLFVAVSESGTANRVMTSPDGINWTLRDTTGKDNNWKQVTYGDGLFVAISNTGTGNRVMTSPEGINWTLRDTTGKDNSWNSVTYGNGLFVAVSDTGTGNRVMTSPDGVTWTTSNTTGKDYGWFSVTYGNGLFVAVAYDAGGSDIMTSPDGITWTTRTSPADNNWDSVTYGNGLFVAVAQSGTGNRVMTSPDGITWTAQDTTNKDNQWYSVTYGNGLFVAVSLNGTNDRVMTSPDGVTWTLRTSAANNVWRDVVFGGGNFVAVSNSGTANRVMTSGNILSIPLAAENASATLTSAGQVIKLRQVFNISGSTLSAGQKTFKLQYAEKSGTCDTSFTGETYADITSSSPISFSDYYLNADGQSPIIADAGDPDSGLTKVNQSYGTAGTFTSTANITAGQAGLWEFALTAINAPTATSYCIRTVESNDTVLGSYSNIPEIQTTVYPYFINGSSAAFGAVASGTLAHKIEPGSDRVLVVAVTPRDVTNILSTVTFTPNQGSATNMRLIGSQIINSTVSMYIYTLNDADVNLGIGEGLIKVTYTGTPGGSASGITALSFGGADQGASLDSLASNNNSGANGTSISTQVTSVADEAIPFDFFYVRNTATSINIGANQTLKASSTSANSNNMFSASTEAPISTPGDTATMSWSWTNSVAAVQYAGTIAPVGVAALDQLHYRWRNDSGTESNAGYLAAEDTAVTTGLEVGERVRLRFLIKNNGGGANNYTYRLEHSSTSCSTWIAVPTATTNNPHWVMDTSTRVSDGQATTDSAGLSNPAGTFVPGYVMTLSNQTPALSLNTGRFTEIEYSLKSTSNISIGTLYCFRVTNGGVSNLFTFTQQPQITIPAVSVKRYGGGGGNAGGESNGSGPVVPGGGAGGGGGSGSEGGGQGESQGGGGSGGGGGGDTGFIPTKFFALSPNLFIITNDRFSFGYILRVR